MEFAEINKNGLGQFDEIGSDFFVSSWNAQGQVDVFCRRMKRDITVCTGEKEIIIKTACLRSEFEIVSREFPVLMNGRFDAGKEQPIDGWFFYG